MTEQSSCKRRFFGKYLLYRIGTMKGNLLICLVLNLLGLPFFALGHLHMSAAQLTETSTENYVMCRIVAFAAVCVYVRLRYFGACYVDIRSIYVCGDVLGDRVGRFHGADSERFEYTSLRNAGCALLRCSSALRNAVGSAFRRNCPKPFRCVSDQRYARRRYEALRGFHYAKAA